MARFSAGTIVEGKYEVDRVIGSGGMGEVYLVRHKILGQRFAMKTLHPGSQGADESRRFLTEAKVTALLDNDHIVKTVDFGVLPDGSSFSVMEYLEGEDLQTRLQRSKRLPADEAVKYILQACVGLAGAHRDGVVHRDLKPANLFLATKRGGAPVLKILDFGIAKNYLLNQSITSSDAIFGTPTHMSPEQLRASKNVDHRADLWALGVILYELVTGELPFDSISAAMYFGEVLHKEPRPMSMFGVQNAALESVIMRLLKKDPNERVSDVVALAAELAPFASFEGRALSEEVAAVMRANHDSSVGAGGGGLSHAPTEPAISANARIPETPQIASDTQNGVVATPNRDERGKHAKIFVPVALGLSLVIAGIGLWARKSSIESEVKASPVSSPALQTVGALDAKPVPAEAASAAVVQPTASTPSASSTVPPRVIKQPERRTNPKPGGTAEIIPQTNHL